MKPTTEQLTQDHVTVALAADLLHVNQSTIRRSIRQGKLAAYRIGERRLALNVDDLNRVVMPVRGDCEVGDSAGERHPVRCKLTPEEVRRGLAAMDRAEEQA